MSKLTHSCVRNTIKLQKGDDEKLLATVNIPKGTILTEFYNYVYVQWKGIMERRRYLFNAYHFLCKCIRCLDPTEFGTFASGIKCQRFLEDENKYCPGYYLPLQDDGNIYQMWGCNNCKEVKDYDEELSPIYSAFEEKVVKLQFQEKLDLLDSSDLIVHENHSLLMKLRHDLLPDLLNICHVIPSFQQRRMIAMKLEALALKCLEINDKFNPGRTIQRGNAKKHNIINNSYFYI